MSTRLNVAVSNAWEYIPYQEMWHNRKWLNRFFFWARGANNCHFSLGPQPLSSLCLVCNLERGTAVLKYSFAIRIKSSQTSYGALWTGPPSVPPWVSERHLCECEDEVRMGVRGILRAAQGFWCKVKGGLGLWGPSSLSFFLALFTRFGIY